jgi:hypothetical protein
MATAILTGYANAAAVVAALDAAGTAVQPADVAVPTGEGQADGLMTHEDKAKRDGLTLNALAGAVLGGQRLAIVSPVSGALTTADHSGRHLVTGGNVTVPNAAGDVGFTAVIEAGGAHTVSFNGTTSAALAEGDVMTVTVKSTSAIVARKSAAADQVAFT